jgi:prepilin-type N-terminal cleavage/methylation domain-containing protein
MNMKSKQGFTLVEVVAAVVLLVMALGLALSGYLFSLNNVNQGDVQNELDSDVQLAMERLKKDLRLSSLDAMFYYPSGAGPYEAICFPLAEDSDGDGLLEEDADGKLLWDETVIYHIRPTTPNQLVKTTFKPRDNSLSDAQRQAQLESVVKYGHGSSTYNSQNASSKAIFENLLDWEINPKAGRFDAYSPVLTRESSSLGYILLDPGTHAFTFTAIDKNSRSGGYKIGIDQLFVSPSYSEREAEAQLPVAAQTGATASRRYMAGGSWKGNHQLFFPAGAVGDSFTLKLNNDQWEETNFGALGYLAENTEFIFDDTLSPKDNIVQLRGNDISWEAEQQSGSTATSVSNNVLMGSTVKVHINGSKLLTNGGWLEYNGRKCRLTFQASAIGILQVEDVYIGKTTSLTGETTEFSTTGPKHVTFHSGSSASYQMPAGTSSTSDWIDFEINTTNNYLVQFKVRNEPTKSFPMAWRNRQSGIADCVVNGSPTNYIFGLKSITASYPENGTYTSQIFDTHLAKPKYGDISWNASMPSGTALSLKVRTGSRPNLSDAVGWSSVSASSVNPHSIAASYRRYIQFQTRLTSSSDGTSTPKLKDVTIDWGGERQLVDIGGIFTKGPGYGMFEISVDGDPLRSALIVDLEIYRDERVVNKETRRITSALQVELTPRNNGK